MIGGGGLGYKESGWFERIPHYSSNATTPTILNMEPISTGSRSSKSFTIHNRPKVETITTVDFRNYSGSFNDIKTPYPRVEAVRDRVVACVVES